MNLYEVAEDAYLARAGTVSTNGIGAAVDAIEPLIRADERERIAADIEAFRLALPEETLPLYHGHARSRDDMSWALAQVRDRVARGDT